MPNRILMNEADSSPGGGASTPSADPAASQGAQPGTPQIPVDALKGAVTEALAGVLPELRNGIFADLRKAGVFKQDKQVEHSTSTPPDKHAPGAPAPAGLSMADVEAMLERERVIASRAAKFDLNDAAVRRMKSALQGIAPDQLATEADSFLNDLGLAKAPTTVTTTTATQASVAVTAATQPISDKGSPAPGGVLDWEREFAENPIGMSSAARQRMDAKYGPEKARKMRLEAAQVQAQNVRVTKPQG